MNNTTNMIFSFLGGAAIGAIITYGVMQKLGYMKPKDTDNEIADYVRENTLLTKEIKKIVDSHQDRTSFDKAHKPDTHKVHYDAFAEKPDPEQLAKKYEKEMAEKEYPRDDTSDEEEINEETELENEIGEAFMKHAGDLVMEEIDGFGHILRQANTKRRDAVIYVVHQDYAGEIYPLEDLTYYSEDKVLCDVTDAPINNIDALVGDALDDFGGYCGDDPDIVYVRNCSLGFEYEIHRIKGYYGAHIYGVPNDKMAEVMKSTKRRGKEEE